MENSEILLEQAIKILEGHELPENRWAIGGGTVLGIYLNHRTSQDIDILKNYLEKSTLHINSLMMRISSKKPPNCAIAAWRFFITLLHTSFYFIEAVTTRWKNFGSPGPALTEPPG